MKKALLSLCLLTTFAFSGMQVFAADDNFRAERPDDFYKPSSAKLKSDGSGKFQIVPDSSVITPSDGYITVIKPDVGTESEAYPSYPQIWQGSTDSGIYRYSTGIQGAKLGTLCIPSIGLTCPVYEGESPGNLSKGAGHFICTSLWDGNIAIAGHNRGGSAYFRDIKSLKTGDLIQYTTEAGTRTYSVYSSRQISVSNLTLLSWSDRNIITLITCIANEPGIRTHPSAVPHPRGRLSERCTALPVVF